MSPQRLTAWCQVFLALFIIPTIIQAQGVAAGPSPLPASSTASAYMRGASDAGSVQHVRVVGTTRTAAGITFNVILLDAQGNALAPDAERGFWQIRSGCRGETMATLHEPIVTGVSWQASTPPSAAYVLVDHALSSNNLASAALRSLADVAPGFVGADSLGVAIFDHEIFEVTPIDAPYRAAPRCAGLPQLPPAGIPAIFHALRHGISVLAERPEEQRQLVIVTSSNDAASLGQSAATIADAARRAGVTITAVLVGPDVRGYEYRYLTAATGGTYYRVDADKASLTADIVREQLYSAKHHMSLFVATTPATCDDQLFSIGWLADSTAAVQADTILVTTTVPDIRTRRAVIAMFADTTNAEIESYTALLGSIAEELLADSTKILQLVGHVSPDVRSDHDERALERAQVVAAALRSSGVPGGQIRVRSDGSRHPLYYLQLDGTQRMMNNRVEAYYLMAADEPFTILVGQYATENDALRNVDSWKERGFKCYMEPILDGRLPAYQVRLWGYASLEAAEADAKKASTSFKAPMAVVE